LKTTTLKKLDLEYKNMATNRLFTFNNGPSIGDALQYGNLAISTSSVDGYKWWPGPDEDLGYVIAHDDTNPNMRTEGARSATVSTNSVGFWRTSVKSNAAFLTMVNELLGQNFVDGTTATDWLLTNGYWTSYDPNGTLGTIDLPASSAQALYDSGVTSNGWYYIQTSTMAQPRRIYCNMTDEGGGWMLMTYNPDLNSNYGAPYPNEWIGGQGSLDTITTWDFIIQFAGTASNNTGGYATGSPLPLYSGFMYNPTASFSGKMISINAMDVWYHNGSAQCSEVMRMASPDVSLDPLLSNMEIANKISYTNPNNLLLTATFSARKLVDGFTFSNGWGSNPFVSGAKYSYPTNTSTNQRVDRIWRESLIPLIVNKTSMTGTWSGIKGHTKMDDRFVTAPGDWIIETNILWSVSDSYSYQDGQPDPSGGDQSQTEYTTHHLAGYTLGSAGLTRWYISGSGSLPASAATSSIWGMADVYHGPTGWTFSVTYNPATSSYNHFNNSGNVTSFSSSPLQPQTATMSSKRNDLRTLAIYIK
jgi:hypothetical protein